MGAGTRILAGCGCLAIVGVVLVVAVLALGLVWVKDQALDMAESLRDVRSRAGEISRWEAQANAHPYEPPSDGVIPEDRLVTFLAVRRDVHEVYQAYKSDLEELGRQAAGDEHVSPAEILEIGARVVRMFGDLRLAQVKALAQRGMSEREYYALQTAVYVTAGAAKTEEKTGRTPSEAVSAASRRVQQAIRVALEAARRQGVPGVERVSDSDVAQIEEGVEKAGGEGARALSVPPANLGLFRKHEDEIERYAMTGLALLGL